MIPDAIRFNLERDEVFGSLSELDDGQTDEMVLLERASETVKHRWGPERYAAMRNASAVRVARLNRRRANGGTDGRAFRYVDGAMVNDNGKSRPPRSAPRGQRRRAARQASEAVVQST